MASSGGEVNTTPESYHQQTEQTSRSVQLLQNYVHPQHQRQTVIMSTQSIIAAATATILTDDVASNEEENDTFFSSPVDLTIKK